MNIKAIIGLGNPGHNYIKTRHNIGFIIIEKLAQELNGTWTVKDLMQVCKISINNKSVILIKPEIFMNSSGKVIPYLLKQGIAANEILVVHDELELPFGKLNIKSCGSAKGHNGLKSVISAIGDQFTRLRFGISRPENKDDVPDYVLSKFTEPQNLIDTQVAQAVNLIIDLY